MTKYAVTSDDIAFRDPAKDDDQNAAKATSVAGLITNVVSALQATSDPVSVALAVNLDAYAANIRANGNFYRRDLGALKSDVGTAKDLLPMNSPAYNKFEELEIEIKQQQKTFKAGGLLGKKVGNKNVAEFFEETAKAMPEHQDAFNEIAKAIRKNEEVVRHSFLEELVMCSKTIAGHYENIGNAQLKKEADEFYNILVSMRQGTQKGI